MQVWTSLRFEYQTLVGVEAKQGWVCLIQTSQIDASGQTGAKSQCLNIYPLQMFLLKIERNVFQTWNRFRLVYFVSASRAFVKNKKWEYSPGWCSLFVFNLKLVTEAIRALSGWLAESISGASWQQCFLEISSSVQASIKWELRIADFWASNPLSVFCFERLRDLTLFLKFTCGGQIPVEFIAKARTYWRRKRSGIESFITTCNFLYA